MSADDRHRLSDAEKEALANTVRDIAGRSYGFDAICRSVERILAARAQADLAAKP